MVIFKVFTCILLGYLLGNFSPAFLFGKTKGYDIREEGSGNVGATNVFLLVGKYAFFMTAVLDIMKAFASWKICQLLFPDLVTAGPLAGAACIVGHLYPVFLRFKGGKGLASMGGVVLAWSWKWFLMLLAAAIIIALSVWQRRPYPLYFPPASAGRRICWQARSFFLSRPSRSFTSTGKTLFAFGRAQRCGQAFYGIKRPN